MFTSEIINPKICKKILKTFFYNLTKTVYKPQSSVGFQSICFLFFNLKNVKCLFDFLLGGEDSAGKETEEEPMEVDEEGREVCSIKISTVKIYLKFISTFFFWKIKIIRLTIQ